MFSTLCFLVAFTPLLCRLSSAPLPLPPLSLMRIDAFSVSDHCARPPSRLNSLKPTQFEWAIDLPKDGQLTPCSFKFKDQTFSLNLRGPTTIVFTMPTATSPRVTADIYSLDEEALKSLETGCDDPALAHNELELVPRAATPHDEALDQAVEDAVDSAVMAENADAADMDWAMQAPVSPSNVGEDHQSDVGYIEYAGYEPIESDDSDSDFDSDAEIEAHQPEEGSDDLLFESDDPPFLPLIFKKFKYKLKGPWLNLSLRIQQWLEKLVHEDKHGLKQWGTDLFWIAFIAAHPEFPNGPWPEWNGYAVTYESLFLTEWMKRSQDDHVVCDIRKEMWDEVEQRVLIYYGRLRRV
ncbi:hypothetical protein BC629DRAFT_1444315 [Irpex lacteus]|nr:hypothetical protein BC629DRAFT_1444315 [Irpex lacteus]